VSSSAHIQRRSVTKKAYPAFARPTGLAGYEGNVLALRHLPYLSMPQCSCADDCVGCRCLYCTNSEDARLCWEGKQKEKGPSLQMEKVARIIYFSKRGNSYNAFRGVCCPGAKTQATCVCPHPERQTLRLYDVGMRDQSIEGAGFALKKFHNRLRAAPRLVGRSSAGRNYKLHAAANHYLQNCMQSETWMLAFW
jgi:hypothetical protein